MLQKWSLNLWLLIKSHGNLAGYIEAVFRGLMSTQSSMNISNLILCQIKISKQIYISDFMKLLSSVCRLSGLE